jgi:hypothetical protein
MASSSAKATEGNEKKLDTCSTVIVNYNTIGRAKSSLAEHARKDPTESNKLKENET